MATSIDQKPVRVEKVGQVTVVRLLRPRILEDSEVAALGTYLHNLVERAGHARLLLDFGVVERLTTDLLGRLITLHQKTQAHGGRLALCSIHPDVYSIFETLDLPKLLHIYPNEQEAIRSF